MFGAYALQVGLSHEDMVEAAAWLATKRKKERPASPLPDMKVECTVAT